jgi:hypothetical protein
MIFVVGKRFFSTFCAGENIEWQHILNVFMKKSYSEYSRVLCNKVQKMLEFFHLPDHFRRFQPVIQRPERDASKFEWGIFEV